jgi:hypothetical protein
MKVIFLDNDGVICLSTNWGSRHKKQKKLGKTPTFDINNQLPVEYRFDNFDIKSIKVLNEILEITGAEIVVSSDWRFYATLEELGDYYQSQGISKRPINTTEKFSEAFPKEWSALRFRSDLELERYMEINRWIENHPEVTHWVAVDDLDMSVEFLSERFTSKDDPDTKPGLTNFVLTPKVTEGIKQSGVKEKLLKYLL